MCEEEKATFECVNTSLPTLGMPLPTKRDEFSEKFQTAFDPPLIFGKSCCGFHNKSAYVHYGGTVITVLYDPISHEMHVVQQFNMVKTYPEKTLLYHFHAEKALFKGPKSAI